MSTSTSPYVGPAPIDDEKLFHGREKETSDLIVRLKANHSVLLHSPSGAGKTSLIKSGLIPGLGEDYLVLPVARVGRLAPPGALPDGLPYNRYLLSVLGFLDAGLPESKQTPPAALAGLGLLEYLQARLPDFAEAAGNPDARRSLLVFDQFEELITVDVLDRPAKEAFLGELLAVLYENRFWVLFSLREDYLARLEPYLSYFPDRLSARFRLEFLEPAQAMQAIQQPAAGFGVTFQEEAARQLVKDLRQIYTRTPQGEVQKQDGPFIEPVQLQVVCSNLWGVKRPDPAQITLQDVLAFGNVDNALADYYAKIIAKIAADSGVPERNLREWIEARLITPQGLRNQVLSGADPEYGINDATIRSMIDAYLVREDQRRGAAWLELAHDRLVEPIRHSNAAWFEKNLRLLQRRAPQWEREGRPDDLLLSGKDYEEALEWKNSGVQLKPLEEALLEASQAREKARQVEMNLAVKTQIAERQRRLIIAISILAVIALLAMGAAIISRGQESSAKTTAIAALIAITQSNATQTQAALQGDATQTQAALQGNATQTQAALQGAQAIGEAKQTQTAAANQVTALAGVRMANDTATAEAVRAQQIAQVATAVAQGNSATPEPGETPTPPLPVSQVEGLLAAADRLKDSQPDLALLLGAIAYAESQNDPQALSALQRLVGDVSQTGAGFSSLVASLGRPVDWVTTNPDASLILSNATDGTLALTKSDLSTGGGIRGLPANPPNAFNGSDGRTLALVGPAAEGVSVFWSEQDTINWSKIAPEGITFAALRVTDTALAANNSLGDNNKFPTSWATMISGDYQSLIRGAYWEFDPGQDPVGQMDKFYAQVTDRRALGPSRVWPQVGDLPLILRVNKTGGLQGADLAALVKSALDHLEQLDPQKHKPILYTDPDFWNTYMLDSAGAPPAWSADYPLWVRDDSAQGQPRLPKGWSVWEFWDYRECAAGGCELPTIGDQSAYQRSRFNGTLAQLEDFAGKPRTQQALSDNFVYSYDVQQGELLRKIAIDPNTLTSLAGSQDGQILITGREDGRVFRWDGYQVAKATDLADPAYASPSLFARLGEPVQQLALARNNRWVATVTSLGEDYLWDLNVPAEASVGWRLICSDAVRADPVFSPDSHWTAATNPATVCLWDLRLAEKVNKRPGFLNSILEKALTADREQANNQLASKIADQMASDIWFARISDRDPEALRSKRMVYLDGLITDLQAKLAGLKADQARYLQRVDLYPAGDPQGARWRGKAAELDPPIAALEQQLNSLNELRSLFDRAEPTGTSAVAFSPDSRSFAAGGADGIVWVWDLANLSGSPRELRFPGLQISSLAFSNDNATLAVGGADGQIWTWLWKQNEGSPIIQQIQGPTNLPGDLSQANNAQASTVQNQPGDQTTIAPQNQAGVNSLYFPPAMPGTLLAAEQNGQVHSWNLQALADPFSLACKLAGRNPTLEELRIFGLSDKQSEKYKNICGG